MKNIKYIESSQLETNAVGRLINPNIVLDVGCGIRPQTMKHTFVHICVDAHKQYLDVLTKTLPRKGFFASRLKYVLLNKTVDFVIDKFPRKSVDTIFLLDVIEHLDKVQGLKLINAFCEIARHQIVIFTPLGFISQDHPDGKDAWGLDGGKWQEHKSGWTPEDFDDSWEFLVSKDFHKTDNLGNSHVSDVGAFYAIKTMGHAPDSISNGGPIKRLLFWMNILFISFKLKVF
jgi:hypothetical protein